MTGHLKWGDQHHWNLLPFLNQAVLPCLSRMQVRQMHLNQV